MLDRRSFFHLAASSVGSLYVAPSFAQVAPDRFFLQIVFPGGLDPTYLFDARSLELAKAKKHANYLGEEPGVWKGTNGQQTRVTSIIKPLEAYKDRFSVVNGVIMEPAFDGHDQNVGWLVTGNAFGGEAMLPHLNGGEAVAPLDYIQVGDGTLLTTISNTGNAVPLTAGSAASFAGRLNGLPGIGAVSPLNRFLANRMGIAGRQRGTFGAGARAMGEGFTKMPKLASALASVKIDADEADPIAQQIQLVGEMFKGRVCRGGLFVFDTDLNPDQNLDTHDAESAQALPTVLPKLMGELAGIFAYLATTEFADGKSLLDVTTVMVASEFGRTLTQNYTGDRPPGTDHNPLYNTVLLGGYGVKGGQVFGASDLHEVDETVSGAHLSFDSQKIKPMGRPFDFAAGAPVADAMPETYDSAHYLNFASLANTVYAIFDAPASRHRVIVRNGAPAPVIPQLIAKT